ncbi:MAG: hypothetical protein RLW61_21540 [Gammaproteobacteria bacterium]
MTSEERFEVLAACGASAAEQAALVHYLGDGFDCRAVSSPLVLPLTDEPCVATWADYVREAKVDGAWAVLQRHLPRLRFPVRAGISTDAAYRATTLRGHAPDPAATARGLVLHEPAALTLELHATAAGRVPIIVAGCRADFVTLVQALVHRNEPVAVPEAMGAAIVSGSNNWERVAAHRAAWRARGGAREAGGWTAEFARLRARPELYQDRFIVLQPGWYSAVRPADVDMDDAHWRALSLVIRREHECAHYFTLRVLGAMRNHLLDELLADYAGIVAAAGRYRADWFARFLGIEQDTYREGGRLQNYRGEPPLSDGAFRVLQRIASRAAQAVAEFDERHARERSSASGRARMLLTLARQDLVDLAGPCAQQHLEAAWVSTTLRWRAETAASA